MQTNLPMDQLTKIYTKIRSAKQAVTQKLETEISQLDEQLKVVSNAMKDQMQQSGVTSMKTQFGTVVLGQKKRYWSQDWDEFKKFIDKTPDGIDLLEKRIAQRNMDKFLEDNPGVVPPGLNVDAEFVVSVRKT